MSQKYANYLALMHPEIWEAAEAAQIAGDGYDPNDTMRLMEIERYGAPADRFPATVLHEVGHAATGLDET